MTDDRRHAERRKDWKPPAYQHYAKEWLVDTAHLSLEEQGAFQRYIDNQWINGKLPDDERDRARMIGVSVSRYRRIWERIGRYFPEGLNPRLEQVRQEQEDYRNQQSQSGKAGAEKRWHGEPRATPLSENGEPINSPIADGMANDSSASASATASALPKSKALVALRATPDIIVQRLQDTETQTALRETEDGRQSVRAEITFAYWAKRLGHNKTLLDPKRKKILLARLTENAGDVSELLYAVDGALRDDWTMGRAKESTKKYDGIETIFRDRAQVEKFAGLCPGWRSGEVHPMAKRYAA